jgi:hypothetical protein
MAKTTEKQDLTNISQFVWFETFTRAIEQLPNTTDKALMCLAIYQYGALGVEPTFMDTKTCPEFVFKAIFEATRANIDNSRKSYTQGKTGATQGKGWGRRKNGETDKDYYSRKYCDFRIQDDIAAADKAEAQAIAAGATREELENLYIDKVTQEQATEYYSDLNIDISDII